MSNRYILIRKRGAFLLFELLMALAIFAFFCALIQGFAQNTVCKIARVHENIAATDEQVNHQECALFDKNYEK